MQGQAEDVLELRKNGKKGLPSPPLTRACRVERVKERESVLEMAGVLLRWGGWLLERLHRASRVAFFLAALFWETLLQ